MIKDHYATKQLRDSNKKLEGGQVLLLSTTQINLCDFLSVVLDFHQVWEMELAHEIRGDWLSKMHDKTV